MFGEKNERNESADVVMTNGAGYQAAPGRIIKAFRDDTLVIINTSDLGEMQRNTLKSYLHGMADALGGTVSETGDILVCVPGDMEMLDISANSASVEQLPEDTDQEKTESLDIGEVMEADKKETEKGTEKKL